MGFKLSLGGLLWLMVWLSMRPSLAFPKFRWSIPNGFNIRHPCPSSENDRIWHGVGHENPGGGGARNPFGRDFHRNRKVYNTYLCRLDSDGDGMTNGEELGDPGCTWRPGQPVQQPKGHPGICEPINAPWCAGRNPWLVCGGCNEAKNADHVDIVFRRTTVPSSMTNYYCQTFNVQQLINNVNSDFHIVADEPILTNRAFVHHMLMYGCDEGSDINFRTPQPCGMLAESQCKHTIAGWTVGDKGSCYEGIPAGVRIGKTGFKKVVLEVHWNNPNMLSGHTDNPGMRLYYTRNLKAHDLGVVTFGQAGLRIAPGQSWHHESSRCSSSCTNQQIPADKVMKVVSVGMHMHYRGRSGALRLYRNNVLIKTLAHDTNFDYDSPVTHDHDPPVEIRPGDELQVDCYYDPSQMTKHVYYGDATSDEMCYAHVTYYPKINFNHCIQFGSTVENCNAIELSNVAGCQIDSSLDAKLYMIWLECTYFSRNTCPIPSNCYRMLRQPTDPCFKNDARRYIDYILGKPLDQQTLDALRSCDGV